MEEEVLLDMYRRAWDEFLEAYKQKMEKIKVLELMVEAIFEKSPTVKKAFKDKYEMIKEI